LATEEQREKEQETSILTKTHPDAEWYVVHTYAGYENKVMTNLEKRVSSMDMEDEIFRVVVPTEDHMEIKNGEKKIVQKKIFPGYVLVEMILTDDSWYVVRNTPGVTGFVGMGSKPTPLRDEEIENILYQMGVERPKPKVDFDVGESVKVVSGPFEGFVGTIEEINIDQAKLRVLVNMFGRETPLELDFVQVRKM
jgi:transcriptional antiterminator NusG